MAQGRIEVKFEAKGDKALIHAIKALDVATKELQGQTSKYRGELRKLNDKEWVKYHRNVNTAGGITTKFGRIMSAVRSKLLIYSFAVGLVGKAVTSLIGKSLEQEKAEKKLEVALGRTNSALLNQASALQQTTTFGDEAIISAQSLIAAYTEDEEQIKKATEATLDLAAAKGMDLNAAADLVAKSFGSSTNALQRYGIEVKGAAGSTARLESLTTNLANLYGGQATGAANTLSGAIKQMNNAFGDTNESLGAVFEPIIKRVVAFLRQGAENANNFFKTLNESELETLIRRFEELGLGVESVSELKEFALKEDLIEVNKQLKDMGNSFEDSADLSAHIKESTQGLETESEKVSNVLRQQVGDQEYLNSLLRAQEALEKGTAETKGEGHREVVRLLDEEGNHLGKIKVQSLEGKILTMQHVTSKQNQERVEKSITREASKQVDNVVKNSEELLKLLNLLKERERIEKELDPEIQDTGFFQKSIEHLREYKEEYEMVWNELSSFMTERIDGEMEATRAHHQFNIDEIHRERDEEISALRERTAYKLSSDKKKAQMEKAIIDQKKADEKEQRDLANAAMKEEFDKHKALKYAQAVINIAEEITEAIGSPWKVAAISIAGAMQLATINATKAPTMEYGGLVGGRRHAQGGTLIEAEQGEYVMSRRAVKSMGVEAMNRINRGGGGGSVNISFSGNVLSKDFIEDEAIPQIKEALRMGGDIGVG